MREMTYSEIHQASSELDALGRWENFVDFAKKFYGPNTHKVLVQYDSEYNDEGGSYTVIESLTVEDKDGNELEQVDGVNEDEMYDERSELSVSDDDDNPDEYIVDDPPVLTFPKIYCD